MTEKKIPCEVYDRIVGYFRPVRQWNAGKQQERKDRVNYRLPDSQEEKAKEKAKCQNPPTL